MSVLKEGYLTKQGGNVKNWKRRWFILRIGVLGLGAQLEYYKTEKATEALGTIELTHIKDVFKADVKKFSFSLTVPGRVYYLVADSEVEMEDWMTQIRKAIASGSSSITANVSTDALLQLPVVREGWLQKQGGRVKSWKKRWFVLRGKVLLYYKMKDAKIPQGIINLERSIGTAAMNVPGLQFSFEIATPDRNFLIVANSKEDLDGWLEAIAKVSDGSDSSAIQHITYQEVHGGSGASHQASIAAPNTRVSVDVNELIARGQKILGSDSEDDSDDEATIPSAEAGSTADGTDNTVSSNPANTASDGSSQPNPSIGTTTAAIDNFVGISAQASEAEVIKLLSEPSSSSTAAGSAGDAKATSDGALPTGSAFDEMQTLLAAMNSDSSDPSSRSSVPSAPPSISKSNEDSKAEEMTSSGTSAMDEMGSLLQALNK